ncbi:hypothetical protein AC249_AIPGENE28184 [Exaiptasia diaphana]|nr:hypothetical protein AC249_AIPGENE28184 [Exaiptasia diaphana]
MSPGVEADTNNLRYANTSTEDYDKLCSLEVLGLNDPQGGTQDNVYETFKQQVERDEEGWYKTGLLWKPGVSELPNNKAGKLARLHNLVRRLGRSPKLLKECDKIIKEQEKEGIIEKAAEEVIGREFYLPFKPVVWESAESTKTRLVYEGSAKPLTPPPPLVCQYVTAMDGSIAQLPYIGSTGKEVTSQQRHLVPTEESESGAKPNKFKNAEIKKEDIFDKLLAKHPFWKTMRITAWLRRFLNNYKSKRKADYCSGSLKTDEINTQVKWWINRIQQRHLPSEEVKEDVLKLNLDANADGLLECRGRIDGHYPLYLTPISMLAEKLVMDAHLSTLHGVVGNTMAAVRERYWIPRLRYLTKRVIKSCHGCKRFHATPFPRPPVGNLPRDRTVGQGPFHVVGLDYAGPISYKSSNSQDAKVYILLISCSLTRAVHLEDYPFLEEDEEVSDEEIIKKCVRYLKRYALFIYSAYFVLKVLLHCCAAFSATWNAVSTQIAQKTIMLCCSSFTNNIWLAPIFVEACLWPSVPLVVNQALVGTALGLATTMQMIGIGLCNLVVGSILDIKSVHKWKYMMIFLLANTLGCLIMAILLNINDYRKKRALELTKSENPPRKTDGKKKGYVEVMKQLWEELGYSHLGIKAQNLRDQAARLEKLQDSSKDLRDEENVLGEDNSFISQRNENESEYATAQPRPRTNLHNSSSQVPEDDKDKDHNGTADF